MNLLIPFAAPLAELAEAWLDGLPLPHLNRLMPWLAVERHWQGAQDSYSPPHERALADLMGLPESDGAIPWAAHEARTLGLACAESETQSSWACLQLCHWRTLNVGMSMTDPQDLELTAAESQAFFDAMQSYFAEDGLQLFATSPGRWLVRGALLTDLRCAALDRVIGRPVQAWLPQGPSALKLLRLQNEMQMLLYNHHCNEERAKRGQPSVNSFWLSAAGALPAASAADAPTPLIDSSLRRGALSQDAVAWQQAWRDLDHGVMAQALAHVQGGGSLHLILCGESHAVELASTGLGPVSRWWRSLRAKPVQHLLKTL